MEALKVVVAIQLILMISSTASARVFNQGREFSSVSEAAGFRVDLKHAYSHRSLSERSQSALVASRRRVESITAARKLQMQPCSSVKADADANGVVQSPVHVGSGEYFMEVGVGTPLVRFKAIVSTGNDLMWTQCQPCVDCYNQNTAIFDPSKSSTYAKVECNDPLCSDGLGPAQAACNSGCGYNYSFAGGAYSAGLLSYETWTIGQDTVVPKVGFGCGTQNIVPDLIKGGGGVVALGRGSLSLSAQIASKGNGGNRFSHCFLPFSSFAGNDSATSPLFFGPAAQLSGEDVKTIPLLNNAGFPFYYYVPLKGITVAGKALDIPAGTFDRKDNGDGGVTIDSSSTLTEIPKAAFTPLVDAVKSAITVSQPVDGSSLGFDLCYNVSSDAPLDSLKPPTMAFNFEGGVDYDLPPDNFLTQVNKDHLCLAIVPFEDPAIPSLLGSIAQQNVLILFDNDMSTLSFKPKNCDSL